MNRCPISGSNSFEGLKVQTNLRLLMSGQPGGPEMRHSGLNQTSKKGFKEESKIIFASAG